MGQTFRPSTITSTVTPPPTSSSDPSSTTPPPSPSTILPKPEPVTVLLPEEALYLLERGSLYIWRGDLDADAAAEAKLRDMGKAEAGCDVVEEVFARKAVRMTVQEGWAAWGEELKGGRYTVSLKPFFCALLKEQTGEDARNLIFPPFAFPSRPSILAPFLPFRSTPNSNVKATSFIEHHLISQPSSNQQPSLPSQPTSRPPPSLVASPPSDSPSLGTSEVFSLERGGPSSDLDHGSGDLPSDVSDSVDKSSSTKRKETRSRSILGRL